MTTRVHPLWFGRNPKEMGVFPIEIGNVRDSLDMGNFRDNLLRLISILMQSVACANGPSRNHRQQPNLIIVTITFLYCSMTSNI
jgi:hypothetical protein